MRAHPKLKLLPGIGLVVLTIGIYLPALGSLMVADDFIIVGRWGLGDAVRSLHDTVGFGRNESRPLVAFSYAMSNALWSGAPHGYHLDNVLVHTLNVSLLYLWLLLLTRSAAISGMAAALFALHPIHDERVVWITARDGLLSTLFTLLALISYTLARLRSGGESGHRTRSVKILIGLSAGCFMLSLLSYEGAVVVPGIAVAMEFLLFTQPEQGFWNRLRTAVVKTRWHMLILIVYLAWWILLFGGKIGQYNPSFSVGNMFHNYYSLLYQLFYGNAHFAGALYFGLLFTFFLMPREHRRLAAFSLAFMLLAFIPFMLSTGFAGRFAYAGAAGYATLLALMIYSCAALKRFRAGPALVVLIFVVFSGYYAVGLRARISEWVTAGQIADSIPRRIKALHPDLPEGTQLVLAGIPARHGHAYVYPLGLEASIQRFYPTRNLRIIYGPSEMTSLTDKTKPRGAHILYFNYVPERQGIEEIVSRP